MPNFPPKISLAVLILLLLVVVSGVIGIGMSLLLGIAYALIIGNHYQLKCQWASGLILKSSIVLLGFSLQFVEVIETAKETLTITIVTIVFALVVGVLLGKLLKIDQKLSFLIASGTAICGGSAIAAVAPAVHARPAHIIISISIVFILNALGLLIFPELGQYLGMNQYDFGLWAALGIHDTSSVVGAAASYGEEALQVATTTKLSRALWIIPLVFVASFLFHNPNKRFSVPVFILLFLAATLSTMFIPYPAAVTTGVKTVAKTGMAISLFLLGTGLSKQTFSSIQWSAFLQGLVLWVLVCTSSYWLIKIL